MVKRSKSFKVIVTVLGAAAFAACGGQNSSNVKNDAQSEETDMSGDMDKLDEQIALNELALADLLPRASEEELQLNLVDVDSIKKALGNVNVRLKQIPAERAACFANAQNLLGTVEMPQGMPSPGMVEQHRMACVGANVSALQGEYNQVLRAHDELREELNQHCAAGALGNSERKIPDARRWEVSKCHNKRRGFLERKEALVNIQNRIAHVGGQCLTEGQSKFNTAVAQAQGANAALAARAQAIQAQVVNMRKACEALGVEETKSLMAARRRLSVAIEKGILENQAEQAKTLIDKLRQLKEQGNKDAEALLEKYKLEVAKAEGKPPVQPPTPPVVLPPSCNAFTLIGKDPELNRAVCRVWAIDSKSAATKCEASYAFTDTSAAAAKDLAGCQAALEKHLAARPKGSFDLYVVSFRGDPSRPLPATRVHPVPVVAPASHACKEATERAKVADANGMYKGQSCAIYAFNKVTASGKDSCQIVSYSNLGLLKSIAGEEGCKKACAEEAKQTGAPFANCYRDGKVLESIEPK